MRLGIRVKEAVAVTLLTFLIVAATTAIHLSQLSRVVVQEASRQADLVARQIYAQTSRALSRAPGTDPLEALRRDRELRSLLDASVGYSPYLLFALIADPAGKTVLHTEGKQEGVPAAVYPRLAELINLDPLSRFSALYQGGRIYETALPLLLNNAPFGSIRLGVSATLLRQELTAAVKRSMILAGIALPFAWLAAMGLAHLILRPIRVLAGEVDRLRRGEFAEGPGSAGGDEFQELSSQLQRLGQELQAGRIATLGGESVKTVQSLVSYSAKLAALGRLTSGVAHEVKNPLNAMMIHLELLRERLDSPPDEVQHSLAVIGGEIRRLDRVVQGFLRFMRPQELAFKTLDLNLLLAGVAALLDAEWRSHGVHVVSELDPSLPTISADEELLRQAFLNILQNAGQAMPDGGTVTIRTEREGRELIRVSIRDEGVGIAAADAEKIFTLYYTTKPNGSGIGLSLVYRIVQMHDGAIEVRSEVGRGTTMTVRLPVRETA